LSHWCQLSLVPSHLHLSKGLGICKHSLLAKRAFGSVWHTHVILRPRLGYVPKVPSTPFWDQVDLSLLCPVHALCNYLDHTESFRFSEQLFVCFGGQQKGKAISKQRIVDPISPAYQTQNWPSPAEERAHSNRSVASSGVQVNVTFARFYNLSV